MIKDWCRGDLTPTVKIAR